MILWNMNILFVSHQAFSEDALIPLSNQLTFTFEGLPSAKLQDIRPVLLPGIKTTTDHNVREGKPISKQHYLYKSDVMLKG